MKTIRAKFILRRKVAIKPEASGQEVLYRLMASSHHGLPVVDEQRKVIGIITEFDLLKAIRAGVDPNDISPEKIMSKNPRTADIETTVEDIIDLMLQGNFTIIPILKNNRYVGVVSRDEIMGAYVEPGFFKYFEE